jgi:glycosyltransferase involved in cell wall biosynthesis
MADFTAGLKKPVTTVLTRCFNEMPYTAQTVERLFEQRFQDFDVIAVDSGQRTGRWRYSSSGGRR